MSNYYDDYDDIDEIEDDYDMDDMVDEQRGVRDSDAEDNDYGQPVCILFFLSYIESSKLF